MVIWFFGQVFPWYFSNSGNLNFGGITTSGTKHNFTTLPNSKFRPPSIALNLSSNIFDLFVASSTFRGVVTWGDSYALFIWNVIYVLICTRKRWEVKDVIVFLLCLNIGLMLKVLRWSTCVQQDGSLMPKDQGH